MEYISIFFPRLNMSNSGPFFDGGNDYPEAPGSGGRRMPSFQGLAQVLWFRKWLILAIWLILGVPAGVLLSIYDLPKSYSAATVIRFPEVVGAQTNVMRDIAITQGESILSIFNSYQVREATVRRLGLRMVVTTPDIFRKDIFREIKYSEELGVGAYSLEFRADGSQASLFYRPPGSREEYVFFRGPVTDGVGIQAKGLELKLVPGAARKLSGLRIDMYFKSMDNTILGLRKNMGARAVGRTNFSLSVEDRDPWLVAEIANTLRDQFLEVYYGTTEVQDVGILVQMEKDLELAKEKLERSQEEMSKFYQAHPELSRQQEASNPGDQLTYLDARQRLQDISRRLKRIQEAAAAKDEEGSPEKMFHWANELLMAMVDAEEPKANILRASLAEVNIRQIQLKASLGPDHPKIAETEMEKREIYRQVEEVNRKVVKQLEADVGEWRTRLANSTPSRNERPAIKVELELARLSKMNDNNQQIYDRIQESYNRAKLVTGSEFFKVTVVDVARPAVYEAPSLKTRLIIAAAAVGLLLAAVIGAFLGWSMVFHTIWSRQDVSRLLGIKLLGAIPYRQRRRPADSKGRGGAQPDAPAGGVDPLLLFHGTEFQLEDIEAFRIIREDAENTLRNAAGNGKLCLLITSSSPNEGKSTCASNLAMTFARKGKRTILIDADFRLGRIARIFNLNVGTGLDDILGQQFLSEKQFLDTATLIYQMTMQRDLVVVPRRAPAPEAGEMISSDRFKSLVRMFCEQFDVVIIDTPPVMITPEPLSLAELADGVIFVCRSGMTPAGEAREAIKSLQERRVKVVGVLNAVRETPMTGSRYKKYSYYYQAEPRPEEKSASE